MNKLELEELKAMVAVLQQKIEDSEKLEQWEPRGGDYWGNLRHLGYGGKAKGVEVRLSDAMRAHTRLLAYVYEFGGDWVADWSDRGQEKYYIDYDAPSGALEIDCCYRIFGLGNVHMSQECAQGLVAKLESGEVVL